MCVHTNTHHQSEAPGHLAVSLERLQEFFSCLDYPRKLSEVQAWIKYIVLAVEPFWFVESVVFHRHFKWVSICQNMFLLYLQKMT